MKFHYIGHACVGIEADDFILLLDPWFGYPFNMDEMFPYPPFGKPESDFLSRVSAIHISHLHGDHLCFKSLSAFPMNIPIYIGSYAESFLQEKLRKAGKNSVYLIPDKTGVKVGPFRLFSFRLLKSDTSFDSLLVLEYQGRHFLFNNDCVLTDGQYQEMKNQFGSFEGGFLGYTYVSPYPSCYDFAWLDAEQIAKDRLEEPVSNVKKLISIFNFNWIVPYASGMRFLNSDLLQHNRSFVDPTSLIESLGVPVFVLEPGDIWSPGEKHKSEFGYSTGDVENWLRVNNRIRNTSAKQSLLNSNVYHLFFRNYFLGVSKNWKETMSVQIEISGADRSFSFYFDSARGDFNLGKLEAPDMVVKFPTKAINSVVMNHGIMRQLYYSFLFQATINRFCGRQSRLETW